MIPYLLHAANRNIKNESDEVRNAFYAINAVKTPKPEVHPAGEAMERVRLRLEKAQAHLSDGLKNLEDASDALSKLGRSIGFISCLLFFLTSCVSYSGLGRCPAYTVQNVKTGEIRTWHDSEILFRNDKFVYFGGGTWEVLK